MIPNRPRFVFAGTDITLSLPPHPWEHGLRAAGAGRMTSAAGVPSSWVTRWEYPFALVLRFEEGEWPSVRSMLMHGMQGQTITFYPDAISPIGYVCYLEEPEAGDTVVPDRGEAGELQLRIELRRTSSAPIDREYFHE